MNIYTSEKYLKSTDDIESYFKEAAVDMLDCGQGYSQEEGSAFAKIGEDYYLVQFTATIESQKQDRGERLYFVDEVTTVTCKKVSYEDVKDECNRDFIDQISNLKKRIEKIEAKMM